MTLNQIKYVTKTAHHHEHITQLGNEYASWTVASVIMLIETGNFGFYTDEAGKRAKVEVRTSGTGKKFVQTVADGVPQNNLLSLPPCKVPVAA